MFTRNQLNRLWGLSKYWVCIENKLNLYPKQTHTHTKYINKLYFYQIQKKYVVKKNFNKDITAASCPPEVIRWSHDSYAHGDSTNPLAKLRAHMSVFYVTLQLARNSRGSYSIITPTWPRVFLLVFNVKRPSYATIHVHRQRKGCLKFLDKLYPNLLYKEGVLTFLLFI